MCLKVSLLDGHDHIDSTQGQFADKADIFVPNGLIAYLTYKGCTLCLLQLILLFFIFCHYIKKVPGSFRSYLKQQE